MTKLPLLVLCAAMPCLPAQAVSRLEFTEILVDPVGANAGRQLVEVRNTGNWPVDTTGWRWSAAGGGAALPAVVVPAGGTALLHIGASGTNSPTDLYLPTAAPLAAGDGLSLFRSTAVTNPADLVDFVAYGGGQVGITVAIAAGQWPSAQETILLPAGEGLTLAHYDAYTYGSRSTAEAWFVDRTPTLGVLNDGGGIFAGGYGCPQLSSPPQIGAGEDDNRPWVGEPWRLDTSFLPVLPALVWVAVGLQWSSSVPLDGFGVTGCFWETPLDIVFANAILTYPQQVTISLPASPLLVGYELRVQALVPAPGANPAGAYATRVILGYPGSR